MTLIPFGYLGYGQGYPFRLNGKHDAIHTQGLGLENAHDVNHYWNLSGIKLEFSITTEKFPNYYSGAWVENPDNPIDSYPSESQIITTEYQVVTGSKGDGSYWPHWRMFPMKSGEIETSSMESTTNLIQNSGSGNTSFFVVAEGGSSEFYMPFTIQPQNSGAFIITSDTGVRDYFIEEAPWSGYSSFPITLSVDKGTGVATSQDFVISTEQIGTRSWYIIPESGWNFSISSASLSATYFDYTSFL